MSKNNQSIWRLQASSSPLTIERLSWALLIGWQHKWTNAFHVRWISDLVHKLILSNIMKAMEEVAMIMKFKGSRWEEKMDGDEVDESKAKVYDRLLLSMT